MQGDAVHEGKERRGLAPAPAMRKLALLLLDLEERGPVQPKYPN